MEIFGTAVDSITRAPIAYATVQPLYPDGQAYASAIMADGAGNFNGRVPSGSYMWQVSSAGYNPIRVTLENAVSDQPGSPIIVPMLRNDMLEPVTVTPNSGKKNTVIYVGLAVAALWYAKSQKWI